MSSKTKSAICGATTSENERCERPVNRPDERCFQHENEKMDRLEFEEKLAKFKNELSELESQKQDLEDELPKVLSGTDPDEEKADEIQEEISEIKKQILRKRLVIENYENQVAETVEKNEARDLIDELTDEIEAVKNEHNEAVQEFETVKDEFLELAETVLTSYRKAWRLQKSIEALSDGANVKKPELDLPPSPDSGLFEIAKNTRQEIDDLVNKSEAYRSEGEFIRKRKRKIEVDDGDIHELIELIRKRILN